jgi:hypothetical protein
VGEQRRNLGPFVAEDSFLRHADRNRLFKDGTVSPEVFKLRKNDSTLSFTYQDESLRDETALDQYQLDKELLSGDLPGLCKLTWNDLTVSLDPALPARHDPNSIDEKYGHLHCCTDPPRDDEQCSVMASLADRNGIVREFIAKRKRKDL